jgi:hypothetical protein
MVLAVYGVGEGGWGGQACGRHVGRFDARGRPPGLHMRVIGAGDEWRERWRRSGYWRESAKGEIKWQYMHVNYYMCSYYSILRDVIALVVADTSTFIKPIMHAREQKPMRGYIFSHT